MVAFFIFYFFASPKLRDPSFGISFRSNSFFEPESNGFPLVSIKYATLFLRKNNKLRVSIMLFLNVNNARLYSRDLIFVIVIDN